MTRLVAIVGALAAILLLSPYLGINLFGGGAPDIESTSAPLPLGPVTKAGRKVPRTQATVEKPKGKQTMVEDLLDAPLKDSTSESSQKLSDIEKLLDHNGENK